MSDIDAPARVGTAPGRDHFRKELREDTLQVDPLLDCLVEITRLLGRPTSRAALSAGLPLTKAGMTPSLYGRAAARAGLATRVLRRPLERIDRVLMPLVLLLRGDSACVLLGWSEDGETAQVLLPEAGQGTVQMARTELAERYSGVLISARPKFRFDQRAPAASNFRSQHWFWGAMLEQMPLYRDILAAALLINVFALALPLFTMNVYDRVVPNFAVETLWMLSVGLALVIGVDYLLRMLRGYFVDLAGSRVDVKLSAVIMERVLGMRLEDRPVSVGSYAATLRSFEQVRDFIASATVTAVVDVPFALLFLGVIAWICWPLAFAPIAGLLLILLYSYVVQGRMHQLSETTFRASAMRNATLVESLTAMETIKAHGAERVMQTRLEETSVFLARVSAQLRLLSSSVVNGVASLQQLVSLATVIIGVYLIHAGELTMGGLIATSMLAGRALQPLGQMVGLLMQYQNTRTALESLDKTMAARSERPADTTFLHRPELRGDITFENVHFTYPGREVESLRGISLRIKAGEKVVVIGRVGSGKTTLQRLLLGLYAPTQGSVRIDGIDLRQLDPADVRRNIGYVAQDPMLFYGTLRDNIAIAAPYADGSAILAAAHVGGLQFVDAHPQGFEMLIGERGESLSGGQRQGVAIARAALLDPPILVMDEPSGAMDYSSEAQLKDRLREYARDRTLLVVTHRGSLLDLADRLVVMDDGRIVADGPRDQVLADLKAGKVGKASA
ncbi:type I secretion system permease/ATPase [Caenimonas sedimenti]|uniref:Cyclolysin secretion/processing ATP-binding protein CyaB n=1 Tax=Caenimonas sedimenti TaxID=2596921 RepID=A0A562ZIF0_9BURK|nr:type I secretion system permease/ATPase [Caenimonas sedimenti]TWO68181.1 type I secretion system permease/ATPase [Caenimonas sedimenti]